MCAKDRAWAPDKRQALKDIWFQFCYSKDNRCHETTFRAGTSWFGTRWFGNGGGVFARNGAGEAIPSKMNAGPLASAEQKILVVDDSEFSREVTREMLSGHGFNVVVLESSLGMSTVLAREKPDLVLMDVEMPALEGDKAVAIARRHALHHCPIVLYSGRPPSELEALARSCGANGYVSKTSDADALASAVRRFLDGR